LISISKDHSFPNLFRPRPWKEESEFTNQRDSAAGSSIKFQQLTQSDNAIFITDYLKAPSRRTAHILDGSGKSCQGTLVPSPTFLSVAGGPVTEVWTVSSTGPALQKGDSGSWVVDGKGTLIGMVTGMSSNDVYVTPFCLQAREIERAQPGGRTVTLPSPLECVLELAAVEFDESRSASTLTSSYVSQLVLSSAVLDASKKKDWLAATLIMAQELDIFPLPEDIEALKQLLCKQGNRVRTMIDGASPLRLPNSDIERDIIQKLNFVYEALPGTTTDDIRQKQSSIDPPLSGNSPTAATTTAPQRTGLLLAPYNSDIEAARNSPDLITTPRVENTDLPTGPNPEKPQNTTSPVLRLKYRFAVSLPVVTFMSILGSICAATLVLARMEGIPRSSLIGTAVVVGATLAAPVIIRSLFVVPPFLLGRWWWTSDFPFPHALYPYIVHFITMFLRPAIAAMAGNSILFLGSRDNPGGYAILFTSGLAAGAPYAADIAVLLYYHIKFGHDNIIIPKDKQAYFLGPNYVLVFLYCVGRDSLAAFTFTRVAKNQGEFVAMHMTHPQNVTILLIPLSI